jgi:hypothetical protein
VKTVAAAAAVFVLALAPVSCDVLNPDQIVILRVSNVDAPATVAANAPFTVSLTVSIGGCTTFSRINVDKGSGGATLVPLGKDSGVGRRNTTCPTFVADEVHAVQLNPPFANPFQIVVDQGPGQATITKSVQVQ